MKQQVTYTLWTCDHYKCRAEATSFDESETPHGWTSFAGGIQEPSSGGPFSLDLCARHAAQLHKTYHVHTDTEDC